MSSRPLDLVSEPVTSATRQTFAAYPWCLQVLDDPRYLPIRSYHQHPDPDYPWGLTSVVLRDHDTIRAVQSLKHTPSPSDKEQIEFFTLYALGSGATGKRGLLHGGVTATLLGQQAGSYTDADPTMIGAHSASCNVKYLHPISIPGAIKIKAWKTRSEGRKHWISADVQNCNGTILASAELLYIVAKSRL